MEKSIKSAMKIFKPSSEVFEALVNPNHMSNYWFSSRTGRIEEGKTLTWRYEEYNAEGKVDIVEVKPPEKIVFNWGNTERPTTVTITLTEIEKDTTIIKIVESGFSEDSMELERMLGQKKDGSTC